MSNGNICLLGVSAWCLRLCLFVGTLGFSLTMHIPTAVAQNVGDADGLTYRTAASGERSVRTSIARLFPGQSYIRLANLGGESVTHGIEIYGLDSVTFLGRAQVTVPPKASIQIQPAALLPHVPPSEINQFLALYIDPAPANQFVQHVRFDSANGIFSDATACQLVQNTPRPRPAAVVNVHTSKLPRYASFVWVYNAGDRPMDLEARVSDSTTGARIGEFALKLPAGAMHSASGIWYQSQAGLFLPTDMQLHTNIEFVPTDGQVISNLIVGHEVKDFFLDGGTANLSMLCPVL